MLEERILRVGLAQMEMSVNSAENYKCAQELVHEAARKGAEIVCLPELFAHRYFAQMMDEKYFDLAQQDFEGVAADEKDGVTRRFLTGLAHEANVMIIGGSFYEKYYTPELKVFGGVTKAEEEKYNTCLVVDKQGDVLGKYRKVHIPHDQYYWEQFYFNSSNYGFVQVQHEKARIAPLICYDQWFPEAARANVLAGAEVLFYPTAIGWFDEMKRDEPESLTRWVDAMRSHASLNGVYTVAVNRAWIEGDLNFWGSSFVCDPRGRIIAQCNDNRAEVLVVPLDMNMVTESQESWGFLKNRQANSYGSLTEDIRGRK